MLTITLSGARPEVAESYRGGALAVWSRHGVRPTERLLIEALPKNAPERILCGFDTEGVVALAAASIWPSTQVAWWHFDAYPASRVTDNVAMHDAARRIEVLVSADLPGFAGRGAVAREPFDVVALPFPHGTETLFVRELLEEAHDVLAVGGILLVATDKNPTALRDLAKEVFGKAEASRPENGGAVVRATRTREKAAWKEHSHVIRFPFAGRTLEFESRPGTFSYGRLDRGTKTLIGTLPNSVKRGARVLDLGCGNAALGLCALTLGGGRATLVDSSARAIDLATRNAARNNLTAAEAVVRADFEGVTPEAYDLALANPPYFGDFRIAESFVSAARSALKKGGELRLVAMAVEEHEEIVRRIFGRATSERLGGYGVVRASVL